MSTEPRKRAKARAAKTAAPPDIHDVIMANLKRRTPRSENAGTLELARSKDLILSRVEYVLTTGIRPFDALVGGFPFGRICEVYGTENCGKTNLMMRCALRARQFLITQLVRQPDGTVVRQSVNPDECEVAVLYIDNETSFDDDAKIIIEGQRVDAIVARADTIDTMFSIIEGFLNDIADIQQQHVKNHTGRKVFGVIIVDTIAATTSRQELEQAWGKDDYPRQAAQISKGFRKLVRSVNRNNTVMICTNQIRENVKEAGTRRTGPLPVDVEYTTFGGRALRFYASQRIFMENLLRTYRFGDSQFENGLVVGFTSVKNRIRSPLRTGRMVLILDERRGGLNNLYSILETLVYLKFVEQERNIFRFRFSWAGIATTTFNAATTTLDEDDSAEDPSESPTVRRGRRDPIIESREEWPAFYKAHKADIDALWEEAVASAFRTEGNLDALLDDTTPEVVDVETETP